MHSLFMKLRMKIGVNNIIIQDRKSFFKRYIFKYV